MKLLKDWKLHSFAIAIIALSEAIGKRELGIVLVFPMLYAMIIGGIVSFPKIKALKPASMNHASTVMGVALIILIVKLGMSVGPNIQKILDAKGALIFQEIGHFAGTILLGLPLAIMLGMGREAVGATYSVGREPNIAIVESKYGLDSPEGRGVMAIYICGTLFGAIWMSVLSSVIAQWDILHPLSLAMGAGVGSGSMMAASVAPIIAHYPEHADNIQAYAASANLMSSILGIYIYIFFSLPFASYLYNRIKNIKG